MAKTSLRKVLIAVAILLVVFLPPFAKYQRLRYKSNMLNNKVKALNEELKRLEEEKKRLKTDITYIEGTAREKIGVVRKGEILLKEVAQEQMKK